LNIKGKGIETPVRLVNASK